MNKTMDAALTIATTEAERAAGRAGTTLEARVRAAMEAVRDHWLLHNENDQFRAAVAGVLISYGVDSPEGKRLKFEFDCLRKIAAMCGAADAGLSVQLPEVPDPPEGYKALGLLNIWKELTGTEKGEGR